MKLFWQLTFIITVLLVICFPFWPIISHWANGSANKPQLFFTEKETGLMIASFVAGVFLHYIGCKAAKE